MAKLKLFKILRFTSPPSSPSSKLKWRSLFFYTLYLSLFTLTSIAEVKLSSLKVEEGTYERIKSNPKFNTPKTTIVNTIKTNRSNAPSSAGSSSAGSSSAGSSSNSRGPASVFNIAKIEASASGATSRELDLRDDNVSDTAKLLSRESLVKANEIKYKAKFFPYIGMNCYDKMGKIYTSNEAGFDQCLSSSSFNPGRKSNYGPLSRGNELFLGIAFR